LIRDVDGAKVLDFVPANLRGSVLIPERITRRFPVRMPSYPATLVYQIHVRWPESVSVVSDPSVQVLESPFFRVRLESSFRGRDASRKVFFESLLPQVLAADLPSLIENARKVDRLISNVLVVGKDEIKREEHLNSGRQTAITVMQERIRATVQATGRAISSGRLVGEDLTEALCLRAESLSDLGDAAVGLIDAEKAVRLAPDSARARECRANLYFTNARFDAAVADYSRAMVLGHDAARGHYRRGIARYYLKRLDLAAEDFSRAVALQQDEADAMYARLWLTWTLRQSGKPLPADLEQVAKANAMGEWPRPALAMLVGVLSEEQMMTEIHRKTGDELEMGLAEAWFYVGQYRKASGQAERAAEAFEQARAKGMSVYIEHVAAGFELRGAVMPR
jgi:lipoprotein NlpI